MSILTDLKNRYINGSVVEKLIYINIVVFILTHIILAIFVKSGNEMNFIFEWFALDHDLSSLLTKPWSIVTYGFLHADFLHVLMNLIVLYYMGNLFIEYFTQKQLLTFYILGTVFGGVFYLLSQNYLTIFSNDVSILVGASAGISAIFIGITTHMPNYQLKLRFIGFVKLWQLAAFWVGLYIIGLAGENAGGNFAHIGGALFGFLYITQASNKEIKIFDAFLAIFKRKKKSPLKTVHKTKKKSPSQKTKSTDLTQQQVDAILDKISKSGYDTLTKSEKEFLFKQGKK